MSTCTCVCIYMKESLCVYSKIYHYFGCNFSIAFFMTENNIYLLKNKLLKYFHFFS